MKQEEVTVQIKVWQSNDPEYYNIGGNDGVYFIPKSYCTVVAPSVEQHEGEVKGEFDGLCNRTACQSPNEVKWYNHSTEKYYCTECAHLLNRVNHGDAQRLFNHNLCTEGKQP